MRVLMTFTGFHDPFASADGLATSGPVLTVLSERSFEKVVLFTTPRLSEVSAKTREEIASRYPGTEVTVMDVPLQDPTNYSSIIGYVRKHFKTIQQHCPEAEYFIGIASGTPQIHACWLMLVVSGEIPGTILQTTPPQFVKEGGKLTKEVDLSGRQFPKIVIRADVQRIKEGGDPVQEARSEIGIIGDDPAFEKALHEAAVYAGYDDIHMLLLGETGTGKECFTQLVHRLSGRSRGPLITVNCSSIPSELVESHLFGHKKGSFTGANSDQEGKFKAADGGILFLDELGELPLSAQAKLLRALEYSEIEPVGQNKPIKVNVRVIAATNRNVREMISKEQFREDLYQRFGATVTIPPLRQRRTDIPALALFLIEQWNKRHRKQCSLTGKALTCLARQPWVGNVRELRRVITQSAMLSDKVSIGEEDLRFEIPVSSDALAAVPEPEPGFELSPYLERLKSEIVNRALEKEGGTQAKAARLLGWSPQALNQYLKSRKT